MPVEDLKSNLKHYKLFIGKVGEDWRNGVIHGTIMLIYGKCSLYECKSGRAVMLSTGDTKDNITRHLSIGVEDLYENSYRLVELPSDTENLEEDEQEWLDNQLRKVREFPDLLKRM